MIDLLEKLTSVIAERKPVAFTMLVETRGSTPQKAGAAMLVFRDGSQVGTLGGGCVEAEVKRRALESLASGTREILSFQLDNDYGWDDGLICGGRMRMLVDPWQEGDDDSFFQKLAGLVEEGTGCTEACVVDEASGNPSDRFLIDSASNIVARRANGSVPKGLVENLRDVHSRPRPYVAGGVSYVPHLQRCKLIVVGAGHVGQKVAALGSDVGFDVCVVDDRDDCCSPVRFPTAKRLIVAPLESAIRQLDVDPNTYCVIVTRGHNHDEEALYHFAQTTAGYVGMIGSKRKIRMIFADLLKKGASEDQLTRVHAPLGFEIGSQTVPEIAVSIVAELVARRNLGAIPAGFRRQSLIGEPAN